MKKIFFGILAVVAMIATSCQQDVELGVNGGDVATVSIEVGTPTRAYSDGNSATVLKYAVYTGSEELTALRKDNASIANGKASVQLTLALNKTYTIVFWAQAGADAPYTFNGNSVTVSYENADCNDESRDAFYGVIPNYTVTGAATLGVELYRPFAQVNVGTTDLQTAINAGFVPTTSKLVVNHAATTLNLLNGDVDGDVEATFATAGIPSNETFPVVGCDYMAMSYVLAGKDQSTHDVTYTITAEDNTVITRTVGSVPMKANHRTNLYGALLTALEDVNVEIKPGYNEPGWDLCKVFVDGVVYTNFREAVAKALELNKPIEFVEDIAIEADETITVPAGQTLTLNLNGCTLSGVTVDADKNDDGQITSFDNEVMFDVRGTMNVNGGTVTIKHEGEGYENFAWNACGEAFYVAFNGVLNVNESTIINYGGVPMAYAIDLVNASATRSNEAGVHLNVESSVLKSSYIPVRVFNNGAGMNHVTIKNSTLEGTSRAFWVQIYTAEDNKGTVKSATLDIDIYNNNNIFKADNENRLIEYGFTNEINVTPQGVIVMKDAEGNVIEGIGMDLEGNYAVTAAAGLAWIEDNIVANNGFAGKTIKLANDIDLLELDENGEAICFRPIGNYKTGETFAGVFDGQDHTIKNLNQNTWALDWGYHYGTGYGLGLFSRVEDATIKNLTIDNAHISGETALCGIVAATAFGDCTFENITVTNSQCNDYQYMSGGIVGWASGNHQYINCNVDASTTIGGQWGDFGNSNGGIIGRTAANAVIYMKDCNVACCVDAVNDVVSAYRYYAYRCCGMLIGNTNNTQDINGTPYAAAPNLTCENVTVTYGDWMNYHYCEFAGTNYPYVRVEAGVSVSGYVNIRYGHPTDANGNTVVDHNHAHNDGEDHHICLPFDQLLGGGPNGDGRNPVYGLREFPGVTVNYPASYRREVSSAAALTEALGKGVSVILDADIDFGSNQLAITGENQVVDLGGHALTTSNNWGGISLKNGASIKNGTITHAGNTAAIKAFNGTSVENVTINATCATADKTVTGIAVQQGANVESIKNVTINGVSQGIEVGYQATVGLIEKAVVNESNNGTAKGIGLVINGGKVGKAKDCTFNGETYGITLHLKGVFAAGLELENCKVEGTTASIYAWDEKGISNTSGSLVLTYDAATTLTGDFIWDFEDECQSVVTLNRPQ